MVKRLSLLYFNDGESIYIYRDNEIQQQLFQVKNISLSKLKEYLQDVGLYDLRYPLHCAGHDQRTFYLSGPPYLY